METKEFKEKHGGYNPYELKIHQRGFRLGILFTLLIISIFSVLYYISLSIK